MKSEYVVKLVRLTNHDQKVIGSNHDFAMHDRSGLRVATAVQV